MIGKLFTGWFSDISWVDPFSLFNSYVFLSGATVCFLPLCTSYEHFAVVMAIYGFFTSFFMLKTIVLVELLGLENLTSAYRWLPFVKSNAIACWITWLNWLEMMIFCKILSKIWIKSSFKTKEKSSFLQFKVFLMLSGNFRQSTLWQNLDNFRKFNFMI